MRQRIRKFYNLRLGSKKTGERPEGIRFLWPAIFLFFMVGIIGANIINGNQSNGYSIWSTYFIEKFKYASIQPMELFYYVLEERLPIMMILLLFSVTNWGTIAGVIFLSWQSFAAGFLMAVAVIAYGLKGILLMGAAVFPQYLFYFPIYIVYIYLTAFLKRNGKTMSGVQKNVSTRGYLLFLACCLSMMMLYITGIFLESYVNPYLLKKILKIF